MISRLSSSAVKAAIFFVKQTKVLASKDIIKDPFRSVVSGKEDWGKKTNKEIKSSSPYVLSSRLKVSQYFSWFPISQQCNSFFKLLNIGKNKCNTTILSPSPPPQKRKKPMKLFKKTTTRQYFWGVEAIKPRRDLTDSPWLAYQQSCTSAFFSL